MIKVTFKLHVLISATSADPKSPKQFTDFTT